MFRRGEKAMILSPCWRFHFTNSDYERYGWLSSSCALGRIHPYLRSISTWGWLKFDIPICRTSPSRTSSSMAHHVSRISTFSSSISRLLPGWKATSQCIRYRSRYSSPRSCNVLSKAWRTDDGRWSVFHSLLVTQIEERGIPAWAIPSPTSFSLPWMLC